MAAEYVAQSFAFDATGVQQLSGALDPSAGAGIAAAVGSIYQRTDGALWQKTGALDTQWTLNAAGGGVTLDQAYDFGGAGVGRAITADAGAVTISSTVADNNHLLELTKNPVGAQLGDALHVVMGDTTTGLGLYIERGNLESTDYDGALLINPDPGVDRDTNRSPILAFETSCWENTGGSSVEMRFGIQAQGGSDVNPVGTLAFLFSQGTPVTYNWAGWYDQSLNWFFINDVDVGNDLVVNNMTTTLGVRMWEVAADPAGTGAGEGTFWVRNDATTVPMFTDSASVDHVLMYSGAAGVTLDGAYDFGGAGVGRSITADTGAVTISSAAADNNGLLELTKNPAGAQSGAGLSVTMTATTTGPAVRVVQGGSGLAVEMDSGGASDPGFLAGTADPSAGGGVAAPEGSIYERFVATAGEAWLKTGAADTAWAQISTGAGGVTLDGAYDFGGAGVGRAITADAGAVTISSTAADDNNLLELTKNSAGAQSGNALHVVMGDTTTGLGIYVDRVNIGIAQEEGVKLTNSTAALDGVPQNSPMLVFEAHPWNGGAETTKFAFQQYVYSDEADNFYNLVLYKSIASAQPYQSKWIWTGFIDQYLVPDSPSATYPQIALGSDQDTGMRLSLNTVTLVTVGTDRFNVTASAVNCSRQLLPGGSTGTYNLGSSSQQWLSIFTGRTSMAATTAMGYQAVSITNATAGVPVQHSPVIEMMGKGWDTAGLDSDEVWGALQVRPVSGNPVTGQLHFLMDTDVATPVYNSVGYADTAGDWYFPNNVDITGKLTVGGLIDPTGLLCAQQAADPGSTGAGEGTFWVRNDATTVPMFTDSAGADHVLLYVGSASGTLDQAYDFGGAGAGRAITADAGAVTISSTVDDGNHLLELTKDPTPDSPPTLSGSALVATMGSSATDAALRARVNGLGSGLGTDRSRAGLILEEDSSAASSGTHNAPAIVFHVDYVGEGPSQNRNYWAVQGIQNAALDDTGYLTFGWGAGDISAAGALTNVLRLNNVVNSGVHVLESMVVTHTALASGVPATTLTVTQPADTGLTAANHTVVSVAGGSVEYTTGAAVTLARVVGVSPTTYTATGATQTITTAATMYIEGPPVASTNVTITNPYSLWVDTGITVLDDGIEMVERAAVSRAVTAGRGAVWLKNTTPSSLFFTDDTTIDHDLVRQSIGEIYIYGNSSGQTLNATPGTYDIITQFNSANGYDGSSYNTTNAKASNKITLNKAGTWRIQWSCSFSGTPNRTISFIVYVNGVAQNNVRFERRLGATGDVGRAACSGYVTGVTAGQDVDVRATGDTGSESVVCESGNLNCSWVGP